MPSIFLQGAGTMEGSDPWAEWLCGSAMMVSAPIRARIANAFSCCSGANSHVIECRMRLIPADVRRNLGQDLRPGEMRPERHAAIVNIDASDYQTRLRTYRRFIDSCRQHSLSSAQSNDFSASYQDEIQSRQFLLSLRFRRHCNQAETAPGQDWVQPPQHWHEHLQDF